jgi:hypothetical protein
LTHSFPKFGHFRLNKDPSTHKSYKIEKPPNDRKRKDSIMDLTESIASMARKNQSSGAIELMHNQKLDNEKDVFYVFAMYMTKSVEAQQI